MAVIPITNTMVDSQVDKLKKQGYKMGATVDGLILMNGGARNNYDKVVLVSETHPVFNGAMFLDAADVISSTKMKYKAVRALMLTLTKMVKKAFFPKEKNQ